MKPREAFEKPVIVEEPGSGEAARVTRLDEASDGHVRVQFARKRDRGWSLLPVEMPEDTELRIVGALCPAPR